jgi:DNA segregation ATPase FtsK/SpoIIIE, S-DNA-T family
VGIEVPHAGGESVRLGDVLNSPVAASDNHPFLVGLGKDLWGRMVVVNLAKMAHLLIAGSTGSGKSATIHAIITSILGRATPDELRMLLIDPRLAELSVYEGIPHQFAPATAGTKTAPDALGRVVDEMERRYDALATAGFRHMKNFNETAPRGHLPAQGRLLLVDQPYPFLLVVIDEVAGLVGESGRRVEAALTSIARRGRIVGVHLILATDQPSVLGSMPLVRANLPSRLAFRTSSTADSRLILDEPGAETLAGRGDALYLPMSASKPVRIQAAFVSEAETRDIVAHCVKRTQPPNSPGTPAKPTGLPTPASGPGYDSHLLVRAAELIVSSQFGSTSMLQRKLGVGSADAGSLMDMLETCGIVGPAEGSKAREVLVRPDDIQRVANSLPRRIKADN